MMQFVTMLVSDLRIISMLLAVPVLVYVSLTDIRTSRIPNKVMFPALGVALILALIRPDRGMLFLGGFISCGILLLPSCISRRKAIGGGDVKLGLFIGLLLGWPLIIWALFVTSLSALFFTMIGMMLGRLKIHQKLVYGPFLSFGAMVVWMVAFLSQLGL
jgi:prepilin signal peptidase PulO-like enzyme (type II secretory pathway)